MEPTYKSYEDWYDTGPGSESFKRSCAPAPRRAEDPSEIFVKWAEEYWAKPLLFETLMKKEEDARILALIVRAKGIIVADVMAEVRARIADEMERRGRDTVWEMCYRGEYRGD